mmetsp:Transcript_67668/g.218575  ORF Transcript_67668/g.218575 Transcript_67668/m.218575 type:complete len:547 (+) Transcript_67668:127-1767(+)
MLRSCSFAWLRRSMRRRISSVRLCSPCWYMMGLGAYCRHASLKPASTVEAEPLQDRHRLSSVMTGVPGGSPQEAALAAAVTVCAFFRGVDAAGLGTEARGVLVLASLRPLPPSSSGKAQARPALSLPSPALKPKSETLRRSWSSCRSMMALRSWLSTIIRRTSLLTEREPSPPWDEACMSFMALRSCATSTVRSEFSASRLRAWASTAARTSATSFAAVSWISARWLFTVVSARFCAVKKSSISFSTVFSFWKSEPYLFRMSSTCLAVEVPTTSAAVWKWALTSLTRPPNCCLRLATWEFSCCANSANSCCCSSWQVTDALLRQRSATPSTTSATSVAKRSSCALVLAMTMSVLVWVSRMRCCSFSAAMIRVSNSSRSLESLSRVRSKRSTQYRRSSEASSWALATCSLRPLMARPLALASAAFLSMLWRSALISISCMLRRSPTVCSCSRRRWFHSASSTRKPSTMPRNVSAPSHMVLRLSIASTCLSMATFTSRSLMSKTFCFLRQGSMRLSVCFRRRFSISPASMSRTEESSASRSFQHSSPA